MMREKLSDRLHFLAAQLTGEWLLSYDRNDDERRQKEAFYDIKLKTMLQPREKD